ncbi:hypothetical protein ACFWXK_10860 [Streptomyces sp. NPDC059070]|uniref:hypothetical protein n=1 Tax=Streptomyces sp. NPDC059070 TaxID=3346713 RepID=UPI00369608EC
MPSTDRPHPRPRSYAPEPSALLITGTVGVGKTTAAELVGDLLADAGIPHAVLDLDGLCRAWPAPEDDPFQQRLLLANLRAVAVNHRAAGARHLVLAGVAENAGERNALQEALSLPLRVCRLTAALDTVHTRLRHRHEGDYDPASFPWHLDRAGQLDLALDQAAFADDTLDTTQLTPEAVAATVAETTGWLHHR